MMNRLEYMKKIILKKIIIDYFQNSGTPLKNVFWNKRGNIYVY